MPIRYRADWHLDYFQSRQCLKAILPISEIPAQIRFEVIELKGYLCRYGRRAIASKAPSAAFEVGSGEHRILRSRTGFLPSEQPPQLTVLLADFFESC